MDIEEFGNKLFGEEPRDVKSIKVEFEGFGVKELFENLCMLFTFGMKKHYGNEKGQVNLKNISENDMNKMKKYFMSIGLIFFINDSKHKRESELSEHQIVLTSEGIEYELYFDYMK